DGIRDFHVTGVQTCALPIFLVGNPAIAVGLVTLRPNVWYEGRVALLDELYVEPTRRRQGSGSALIGLMLETCRRRGVDLVEIHEIGRASCRERGESVAVGGA